MSFLALSARESSLVQTFCESCVRLDITHQSVHMARRFVIQGCPTLIRFMGSNRVSEIRVRVRARVTKFRVRANFRVSMLRVRLIGLRLKLVLR